MGKILKIMLEVEARTSVRIAVQALLVLMILSNFLLASYQVFKKDKVKTVVSPIVVRKAFWVTDEDVSPSYVEQMGDYVLDLAYTRAPNNAMRKADNLLKVVCTRAYPVIETPLRVAAKDIKDQNATTVFDITRLTIKDNGIAYTGVYSTYINDRRQSIEQKAVRIKFQWDGEVQCVSELKEIVPNAKDPFNDQEMDKALADAAAKRSSGK
ncbi:TraE/TraK family type IV conjugative transfer system protein [Burkholderia cepacia]|uniref:TraE/TraK family type IV conjugative transfer system protein n=1 Tax=Burkholderia cepacia TaxID=292 RepID=UPI002AB5E020|nr:TraE/TraK family type IV conjugative transfer system protein [Burkholderia cepacia]